MFVRSNNVPPLLLLLLLLSSSVPGCSRLGVLHRGLLPEEHGHADRAGAVQAAAVRRASRQPRLRHPAGPGENPGRPHPVHPPVLLQGIHRLISWPFVNAHRIFIRDTLTLYWDGSLQMKEKNKTRRTVRLGSLPPWEMLICFFVVIAQMVTSLSACQLWLTVNIQRPSWESCIMPQFATNIHYCNSCPSFSKDVSAT